LSPEWEWLYGSQVELGNQKRNASETSLIDLAQLRGKFLTGLGKADCAISLKKNTERSGSR
jgi:hypothetical protein